MSSIIQLGIFVYIPLGHVGNTCRALRKQLRYAGTLEAQARQAEARGWRNNGEVGMGKGRQVIRDVSENRSIDILGPGYLPNLGCSLKNVGNLNYSTWKRCKVLIADWHDAALQVVAYLLMRFIIRGALHRQVYAGRRHESEDMVGSKGRSVLSDANRRQARSKRKLR